MSTRDAIARTIYRHLYPGPINKPDGTRTRETDIAEADAAYHTWDEGREGYAPGIKCRGVADALLEGFAITDKADQAPATDSERVEQIRARVALAVEALPEVSVGHEHRALDSLVIHDAPWLLDEVTRLTALLTGVKQAGDDETAFSYMSRLLSERDATIERVEGLCAVMVRQHHSDLVQVSDVMAALGSQRTEGQG